MKIRMLGCTIAVIIICFAGCKKDEPPSVRVNNERTTKANVQFKQANGNTINQNDVTGGSISAFQDVAEGAIQVTAGIQNESVAPTITFNAAQNTNYTIRILNSTPPALKVEQQSK